MLLILASILCVLAIIVLAVSLKRYRESYLRGLTLLQATAKQVAGLRKQLLQTLTAVKESQSELLLFREVASILGQIHNFELSLKSAFSRMLELLSIDFGILLLGNRTDLRDPICVRITPDILTTIENLAERNLVLQDNVSPPPIVFFEDFQKSRDLDAMKHVHSLLGFPCRIKSKLVGSFVVGFHKPHVYTSSELDALRFCADQFAISDEISKQLMTTQELLRLRHDHISNVSHELRTPLTTIYGYLNILKSYPESMLQDQEKHEMFTVMTDECHRLIRLISNLLLSVQLEQEDFAQKFRPVSVSLGQVLSQALRFMDVELKTKNIEVITDIPQDLSTIEGNSDLLYQVFQNLIGNSIKFCNQNPKIEIVAREQDGSVVIQVADNGIGIPENEQQKIFHKFYRSKSQASNRPGVGIGLYLVKELVHLHGGDIQVNSQPNKGTRFSLTFPKTSVAKSLARQTVG